MKKYLFPKSVSRFHGKLFLHCFRYDLARHPKITCSSSTVKRKNKHIFKSHSSAQKF